MIHTSLLIRLVLVNSQLFIVLSIVLILKRNMLLKLLIKINYHQKKENLYCKNKKSSLLYTYLITKFSYFFSDLKHKLWRYLITLMLLNFMILLKAKVIFISLLRLLKMAICSNILSIKNIWKVNILKIILDKD